LNQKRALGLAVLVLLLGSALRMVALEQSPPGFSLDEACESYDAYSLWHTGRDQHGVFLPTVMRSFGDYRMPLFMYSMAPVVGMAGLSVTTARLTAAFWSILAIAATYWVGTQMFGRLAGLVAALFLAISPWHVSLSRIAYDPNAALLPAALAVGMLWRWQRTLQKRWVIAAAIVSGLGIYTYAVMKLFVPALLVLVGLFLWRTVLAQRRQVLVAAAVGALLAFPAVYTTLRYPEVQARYRDVAVFQAGRPLSEAGVEALQNAWHSLTPGLMFGRGFTSEVWGGLEEHPVGADQLYPVQAVLILVGIGWGLKRRETRRPLAVTGLWLLAGILPAVLTVRTSHEHRLLPAIVPWQLLSGLGMGGLLNLLRAHAARLAVVLTALVWTGISACGYFGYYFTRYSADLPHYRFDVGIREAVTAMDRLDDEYGVVYFNCYANAFPYIDILFFTRYDPRLLQADLPDWEGGSVRRVGKYHFICDTEAVWASGLPGLFVVPADELPDVPPLAVTTYANGQPRFKIAGRSREASFLDSLEWLGQCTRPATSLDTELVAQANGGGSLRQPAFDCASAWLYPAGRAAAGAYVIHHELLSQPSTLQPVDPFIARRLVDARLIWNTSMQSEEFPAFAVYGQEQSPVFPAPSRLLALPAAALPITTTALLTTPVPLAGPLTFLGAVAYPGGETLEVETWWQVSGGPITRPLSIMAHLLTPQGESLGVADGLGISPLELAAGDVVVQRHRFSAPPRGTELWLRTGVYWLDTMERWAVPAEPGADALFVSLAAER
jgi:hypothetical protein